MCAFFIGAGVMVTDCIGEEAVKHVFVDLDETLYSNHAVVEFMVHTIQRSTPSAATFPSSLLEPGFIREKFGYTESDASSLSLEFHGEHGTTMAGLVVSPKGTQFHIEGQF